VFSRKTPQQKASDRKARWDSRVAQAAAIEAKSSEREAVMRREFAAQQAAETAAVLDKARRLNDQGRPVRFWRLGIAVMDGVVFDTTSKLRRLGHLAGAQAAAIRLPPEVRSSGPALPRK
jgi:hypothetical protein